MNHSNKGALGLPCACLTTRMTGEPYSGNLYLRFDEDLGRKTPEITLLVANCRSMERRIKKLNHGKHGLHGRGQGRLGLGLRLGKTTAALPFVAA